ncbi:MAG: hypothetical protein WCH57_00185 [Verrucomicrobiota bacterium]
MRYNLSAEIEVIKFEIVVLKGLSHSPGTDIAEAAVRRERKLQVELYGLEMQGRVETPAALDPAEDFSEVVGSSMAPFPVPATPNAEEEKP